MDIQIFTSWYDEVFLSNINKKATEVQGKWQSPFFEIDSAPSHPNAASIERVEGMFEIIFLQHNVM